MKTSESDHAEHASLRDFALELHAETIARTGDQGERADQEALVLREESFTQCVLELLQEHDEITAWELCQYDARHFGALGSARLSAWSLSADGTRLDVVLSHYVGTGEIVELSKTDWRRQYELLLAFVRRALAGFHEKLEESSEAFRVMQAIHASRNSLIQVRCIVLTDARVRTLAVEVPALQGLSCDFIGWDLEKLSTLRAGKREPIQLDLTQFAVGGLACLRVASGDDERIATYLTYFPATLLARIYDLHGQRLLERNVRAFLQTKGKINRGLQRTLREEPERFLSYNNGLCCTAADIDYVRDAEGQLRITRIVDFQIVNGGQTTASIFHAVMREGIDVGSAVVQVKLTAIADTEQLADMVPLISRFANSQNKVNGADFAANGRLHRRLEEFSRTVWAPAASGMDRNTRWYYERARGSYADDKVRRGSPGRQREWMLQHPLSQKFTKTDVAKIEHAWQGLPHLVCRGAEKNFEVYATRLEEEGEPEVDREFFERLVARAIIWRAAEKEFDGLGLRGYRANSVAYAVAWTAARAAHRIDLDAVWRLQRVQPRTTLMLRRACEAAHEHITRYEGNVGEWSKKSACWDAFRETELQSERNWEAEWAAAPFLSSGQLIDNAAAEWDEVRVHFVEDSRPIRVLERVARLEWIASRREDPISGYARKSWGQLKGEGGRRLRNIGTLVEILRTVHAKAR